MVGAFHMPSLVYSAVSTLKTLDAIQYASGMGEVIKHSIINDSSYFKYLTDNLEGLKNRDTDVLLETVYRSNIIKKEVVELDPKEKGERQLLNFGHTLGHAIEKCSDFSYSHGQCVALGCLAAMYISDVTTEEENKKVRELMEAVGLQTVLKPMDHQAILAATRKDKKMDKGRIRFILIHSLGNAYIDNNVSDDSMLEALGYISN
jgi:3-dehydroquinate synthase